MPLAWLSKSSLQQLSETSRALETMNTRVCKQQRAEQARDYMSGVVRTERRLLYFAIHCICVL